MIIHESRENYLETILILLKEKGSVRSIDIAQRLNYSKPSVSRAVSLLRADQMISVEDNGQIKLLEKGKKIAEKILERHQVLSNYLVSLGVSEETASEDACRIEHVISEESFLHIKRHYSTHLRNKKALVKASST